jgi:foldase protein PrsA
MPNLQRVVASVATGALCLSLAACAGGGSGGDIASVNGQKISRATFYDKLENTPQAKGQLAQMILADLIDQYQKDKKIDVSDAEIQKKEDELKVQMTPDRFAAQVKAANLSEADVHNILRQQIVQQKGVAPLVHVSEADIKAFFDKNHASLDAPAKVRAAHILVPDLKTANMVEAKLKSGAKFDDMAKQYSTDPSTKDKGGELGFFTQPQMVAPFSAAAFAAPVGSITAPVKSPFGFHIIKVEEKTPALKATLANKHDMIRDQLKQQQEGAQMQPFLAQLRQGAKIDIYDDKLKDALPPIPPSAVPPPSPAAAAPASPAASPAKK